jgi:hypothetical protein
VFHNTRPERLARDKHSSLLCTFILSVVYLTPAACPINILWLSRVMPVPGNTKGGIDLLFDWFGISCMSTDNFCLYLKNRQIQTSQAGDEWYSDTYPFSIPCLYYKCSLGALMMTLGAKLTTISDAPNSGVAN